MNNNKAAGDRFEKKIKQYLESLGWTVERALPKIVWLPPKGGGKPRPISIAHDFFGCIDLIGAHPEKAYTLMIQATLDTSIGRKYEAISRVPWNLGAIRIQVWQRQEGIVSGIKVRTLRAQGTELLSEGWGESIFRLKNGVQPPAEVL